MHEEVIIVAIQGFVSKALVLSYRGQHHDSYWKPGHALFKMMSDLRAIPVSRTVCLGIFLGSPSSILTELSVQEMRSHELACKLELRIVE